MKLEVKMASQNKKNKLKNSYCSAGALKNKLPHKCKRLLFYTPSQRKDLNKDLKNLFKDL